MERLTKRDTDGQAMMDCEKCKADWTGKHGKPMVDCTALYCRNRLKARLAAYEDTGLTPGEVKSMQEEHFSGLEMAKLHSALMELKKYQEADKDGRLVVLPCKTRQEKLLEQYPTADVDENGILEVCPALLFASHRGKKGGCSTLNRSCDDCRKEFWGLWDEAALEAMKDGNG